MQSNYYASDNWEDDSDGRIRKQDDMDLADEPGAESCPAKKAETSEAER